MIEASSISYIFVFLEGIISFFSPCIIPLIPVYMSYLAGSTDNIAKRGMIKYSRKKVLFHTIFFVLGISFAFFILGMTFTVLGTFFQSNQLIFTRIAGILIILLGLFQLGFFEVQFLNKEKRISLNLSKINANPLVAFIMGFTFSFAWTPCVGPALSTVLIMASSATSSYVSYMLILLYTSGFIIPFLLLGLFTTQALNFLKKHQHALKHIVKLGGVILIIIGIMTFTGWLNSISGYLNSFGSNSNQNIDLQQDAVIEDSEPSQGEVSRSDDILAFDFTLIDQYGKEHTLSDYKGKVVFLNFWATWCPPCQKEMPDIESLYREYNVNKGEVIFIGVANPRSEDNKNTREVDKDGVISFLSENKYTFPVVFDQTGEVFAQYRISALPTTFIIDKKGNINGYAPGMLTKDIMKNIIKQALNSN